MKKIIVIYKSNHGHIKKYAEMIASKLNAKLVSIKETTIKEVLSYDVVIFGGPIHDKYIYDVYRLLDFIEEINKPLIIFTCGIINPSSEMYNLIFNYNFKNYNKDDIKLFYFPGGIDKEKMTCGEEMYFDYYMKEADKDVFNGYYQKLRRAFRRTFDFTDEKYINELIDYVQKLIDENE